MRKTIAILAIVLLSSCNSTSEEVIDLSILSDRTSTFNATPNSGAVRLLLGVDQRLNAQFTLRYQNVGDTDYNSTYKIEIEGYSVFNNSLQRQSDMKHFLNRIDTLLVTENEKSFDYRSSSIFLPLLDQLITSKTQNATKKIVALWSDLGEISDFYNILNRRNRRLILDDPIAVAEHFQSKVTIPDLKGVTLYIIHLPSTREENRMFRGLCKVYKEVFKDSGLEIQIGLENQIPLTP